MKKSLLLSLLLVAVSMLHAATYELKTLNVGGTDRTYNEYVPAGTAGQRVPLIISCHGASQDAAYQREHFLIEAIADTAKFITVFPNGIDKSWDVGGTRDTQFLRALIDKMSADYGIDRRRVYLCGFSMGGMLTYHAMNTMTDVIAAFAPISGYTMSGVTATAPRAIPIFHTHGTGDSVCKFDRVQSGIDTWVKHNKCNPVPEKIEHYMGGQINTLYIYHPLDGTTKGEIRLMTLDGKDHWIANDVPTMGTTTGNEIWKFCKNYSLPRLSIAPVSGTVFTTVGDGAFSPVAVKGDVLDDEPAVQSIAYYLDGVACQSPVSVQTEGEHTVRVVVTYADGTTESDEAVYTFQRLTAGGINIAEGFTKAGIVPAGWTVNDGNEERIGPKEGFGSGCRVLQLTGSPRAFDYGLYCRNAKGGEHVAYAKYGDTGSGRTLSLAAGTYTMEYLLTNWNSNLPAVDICIERPGDATAVASVKDQPTANVGNAAGNSFSTAARTFTFTITEDGDYVVALYPSSGAWTDLLLGAMTIKQSETSAIETITTAAVATAKPVKTLRNGQITIAGYNALGQQVK